jgi:hypothetical protein
VTGAEQAVAEAQRVLDLQLLYRVWNDARVGEADMLAIWADTDAYGEAGMVPWQGYDWSGIRDSSAEAVARMARTAGGVARRLGAQEGSR